MKKFLIIVCIIGVIIFLGYIGKDMDLSNINGNNTNVSTNSNVVTAKNNTSNTNNASNNTSTNQNKNEAENTTGNTNETKNETENTTTNNTTNTTENTTNQTNTSQVSTVEEVNTSDEDKAKDLAKKAYGSSDGVYFKVEQVESNGVYIISVRDTETTSALEWYTINVKTGSVN